MDLGPEVEPPREGASVGTHLAIDLGTSSVKALVTDERGDPLGTARREYRVSAPHPGWAEGDPEAWWQAIVEATREAVTGAEVAPTGIGLSGQMHGVVLVDGDGRPVRDAILWPDGRSDTVLDDLRELPEERLHALANPVVAGMAGPMLRWLALHEPHVLREARWALQAKDWLRLRLTGVANSEPSDASATLLFDVVEGRWATDVAEALEIDAGLLAPLIGSQEVAGGLTRGSAEELGLTVGTPVVAGAADVAASSLGTGLLQPGTAQLTVGTGGQLVTPLSRPHPRPEAGRHVYRSALPDGWFAMAAILNAGLALGWVRDLFDVPWPDVYDTLTTSIVTDDPLFVPHLVGERTPYVDAGLRGSFSGLGLNHDRDTVLRAALEGVAFALRDAFDALPELDANVRLRLVGGGSSHPAWRQLLADVLGRGLDAVDAADASARGAALLSALGAGDVSDAELGTDLAPAVTDRVDPDEERHAFHSARLERYRDAVQSLPRGVR
jgi:xylulokinase